MSGKWATEFLYLPLIKILLIIFLSTVAGYARNIQRRPDPPGAALSVVALGSLHRGPVELSKSEF